jgi:hypothetical protein
VKRSRWGIHSQQIGLVVGKTSESSCIVMWMNGDNDFRFDVHICDALLRVEEETLGEIGKRCRIAT